MSTENTFKSGFSLDGDQTPGTPVSRQPRTPTEFIPPQSNEPDPEIEKSIRERLVSRKQQDQEFIMELEGLDKANPADVVPADPPEEDELPRNTLMEEEYAEGVTTSNYKTGMWDMVVEKFGNVTLTEAEQDEWCRATWVEGPMELDIRLGANARNERGHEFLVRCRATDPWEDILIDQATRLDVDDNLAAGKSVMNVSSLTVTLMQQYTVFLTALAINQKPLNWEKPTIDMPEEEALKMLRTNMRKYMRQMPAIRWTVLQSCVGIFLVKFHIFRRELMRGSFLFPVGID